MEITNEIREKIIADIDKFQVFLAAHPDASLDAVKEAAEKKNNIQKSLNSQTMRKEVNYA